MAEGRPITTILICTWCEETISERMPVYGFVLVNNRSIGGNMRPEYDGRRLIIGDRHDEWRPVTEHNDAEICRKCVTEVFKLVDTLSLRVRRSRVPDEIPILKEDSDQYE